MRVWDVAPSVLCRQHLLAEHRELHGAYAILLHNKSGYSRHPEVRRWEGKLPALKLRHEDLVAEMTRRGYNHHSSLADADGASQQDELVDDLMRQMALLTAKECECPLAPR